MKKVKIMLAIIALTALAGLILPHVISFTFSPIDAIPGVTVQIPLAEHLYYYGIFKTVIAVLLMVEVLATVFALVFTGK